MFGWLKQQKIKQQYIEDDLNHQLDLDASLNLLSTTAVEVSQEAINAARALETLLRDSEHRFISTIDAVNDLVIVKLGDGQWKTLNKWGQDLFGWLHGEYQNKTDRDLMSKYPKLHDFFVSSIWADNVTWHTGNPHRSRESINSASGVIYQFDTVRTPIFNNDGSRKELIVIARDITEVRQRSKRMKACFHALNSASDVIFIVDSVGSIFFCNDVFLHMFKYSNYNEVVGQSIHVILPKVINYDDMWETIKNNKTWLGPFDQDYNLTVIPMMNGAVDPIFYICTLKPKK